MKKFLLFLVSVVVGLGFSAAVWADEDYGVWTITDYEMRVAPVAGEEKIEFTEIIKTYFDPQVIAARHLEKHGIFRYIPIYLPTDSGFFVHQYLMSDWKVENGNGGTWPYEKTFRSDLNSHFLKIGDANKLISGEQIYEISYTVQNPWRYFEDHDEFYWNITGNYWPVPIEAARLVFDMTALDLHGADIDFVCYTGSFGSTEKNCLGAWDKTKQILTVSITEALDFNEGLTVAISIPKEVVFEPGFLVQMKRFLWANKVLFLPLLVILFFIWAWFKWGKDKHSNRPLVVEYLPADKMPPAMASYLYHLGPKSLDITAEIIWLAVHKYIKIKEIKVDSLLVFKSTEYQFILLKEDYAKDEKLRSYQVVLLNKLFQGAKEVNLSTLKNKFYTHLPKIQKSIFDDLKENGYIKNNPVTRRGLFMFLAFALNFLVSILVFPSAPSYIIGTAVLLTVVSFAFTLFISFFMPRLELEKGIDAQWELKGLHHYMKIAEAERFKFGEMFFWFEKLLPYAVAMGLIKKWAGIMQDIYTQPPEWFEDSSPTFNAMAMAAGISGMANTVSTTVASRPGGSSSGGSGFSGGSSGGGGGGGGGGSW